MLVQVIQYYNNNKPVLLQLVKIHDERVACPDTGFIKDLVLPTHFSK